MTCQSSTGNGCSLEDCYTNLFALADLTGIKWRRLRSETSNLFARPLEDPVLITYIKCLQAEILCAWAKVQYSYGDMPKAANQLGYKRELWIFWYGDEPANLDAIVPKELVEVESGSWDGGMSYECRTFIFKALHNRIERCLLSKKYVRLGRWFVQPHENYNDASVQLSFSFQNFSLHGDSTVCASVDVERHQPLLLVNEQHVQLARCCMPTGIPVILAPYNLAGMLIGQSSFGEQDAAARNLLQEWQDFYPMDRCSWTGDGGLLPSPEQFGSLDLSPLLDVVVAGVHMRYPAQYVLIPKDNLMPTASSTSMPAMGNMDGSSDVLTLAEDAGVQNFQLRSAHLKTNMSCIGVRPRPPAPVVDGVVQKTFEEACILSAKRAPISSSSAAGTGASQSDDEQGPWSLCDPSTKHNCLCGRQTSSSYKSSVLPVIGSRGGPNVSATRSIGANPAAPGKQLKVERENSVPQAVPAKKLSFHRRLQRSGIPGASSTGERLATFSCYSSHRRKVKDSASPLSAVASPACVGGPQSIAATERIMPTLSPQNPSRDSTNSSTNPAANESQSSRPAHHSSHQGEAAFATVPQTLPEPTAHVPYMQGPFVKLPPDLVAGVPAAALSSHLQAERLKRPLLPVHPALDCNRLVDNEDLSTPSLYDFDSSEDWLAHPIKKLKLHPDLQLEGQAVPASQRKAMPYSIVCLSNQATVVSASGGVQGKGSASVATGQPVTETTAAPAACEADQRPAASPHVAAPVAATVPVSGGAADEPKTTRPVISPTSPVPLPFGAGLKSVNSLQPKLSDLDNIFDADEDMDTSLSPDGVHSTDCFANEHGKGSSLMSAVVNGTIGVSELCQMFPTPPSLEGCLALSPAGCHDGFGTMETHCQSQSAHYYDVAASAASAAVAAFTKCDEKQDSPTRFVQTPQYSKYVTCAKYAPIDLPSSKLLSPSLPATPQWHNTDAKIGRLQPTASFLSKPQAEPTTVSAAPQPLSSVNHESLFFVSPSPSAMSCSSHLVGLDNPSPASSSLTRKTGVIIPTPADASTPGTTHANVRSGAALSEANSLIVNIMLSDSLLNLFKDASFDSCNICICNTNIKGTDVGLYLPDPVKEAQYRCTCGFSAAVNRANGYCSGLFHEDEADITGIRDDRFDDHRPALDPGILTLRESTVPSSDAPVVSTENANNMMLIEHCAITYSTSFLASQRVSSTSARVHATAAYSPNAEKRLSLNRSDVSCILHAALEAGRSAASGSMVAADLTSLLSAKTQAYLADWPLPPQGVPSLQAPSREWLEQPKPTRSADVMAALKGLQHILQEACHKKRSTRLWDSSYVVNGPLTWKDFHKMAWRGSEDACKPQPIPSILVGSDKDWVSYSPFVLKYWENLLLRPYGRTHNMAYLVLTPDCGSISNSASTAGGILSSVRTFFRELSTMYETCQLGRHIPLDRSQGLSDGLIQLGRKTAAKLGQQQPTGSESDCQKSGGTAVAGPNFSWINSLGDDALSKKLKLYAQTFQSILAPLLSQQPLDKTLFESSSATKPSQLPVPPVGVSAARPNSSMLAPQPASSTPTHVGGASSYSLPNQDVQEDRSGDVPCLLGGATENLREAEEINNEDSSLDDIGLVIYIVEDVSFAACSKLSSLLSSGSGSKLHWTGAVPKPDDDEDDDDERFSSTVGVYGVLRCYHEFLSSLPECIRSRVQLQIVPLSLVTHMFGGAGTSSARNYGQLSLMKDLCFSVYTQCQHSMAHVPTGRALTSFGPLVSGAAGSSPTASKIYLAPYILAPQKDVQARLGSNYATDGTCGGGVLLCAYCLSEDQRWLLASVTDDSGELRCTKAINVAITDRSRRKRSLAVHRHGLQKLFDFLLDTIARTCMSWRIVIGRLGRLGHEELKVWATLLNHKCLIKANVRMRGEDCRPCSFVPSATDTPTIVSACVTSLEPHKSFKILTDAVRRPPIHKDKHHTATVASSVSSAMLAGGSAVAGNGVGARLLSTPEDVSCTHILVIPNSTTAGGSQSHHDAQLDLPPDLTDDVGIFDFKEDDLDMLFALGESPGHTSMDSPVGRDSMGETSSGMGSTGISNSLTNGMGLMRGVSTSGGNPGSRSTATSVPGAAGTNSEGTDEVSPNLLQQPLAMGYYLSTAPAGTLPSWFWATCPQEEGACPTSLKFALHFHSFLQQQHQDELVGSTSAASQNRGAPSHPLDSSSTCDVLRFVLETYDKLSWLTVDACTNDRQSCLPVHVSHLVQLSQAIAAVAAAVNTG